ncbi:hypothetical protein AKI39_19390 [Bordetella sp. H567]|uniref:type III secretion system inner membrane ring subunit SctD n=1 Tax=Bordetella sp. H567 TaxID=1697043 RepID=UPI00081C644D|nr:type III secretion system inner membrane ring subunit SctD [Bordetella sp. H567]AOB32421.1 hypothetical protein AKI39_19390 [Bordetella sp. H567]
MTQDLELRVLSGLHDGARCAVRDGALIGSQGHCDVVLCDDGIAGEAARLRMGTGSWGMSMPDGAVDGATPDAPYGTPLPLGPILLTITHAAAPWPAPDQIFDARETASERWDDPARAAMLQDGTTGASAAAASASGQSSASGKAQTGRPLATGEDPMRPPGSRRRKGLELRWAVGGLLILLVFGSVASFPPAKEAPSPRMATGMTTDTEPLLRAQRVLAEREYARRVRASLSAQQEIVVTGWVRDELEHDRLATDLSAIWPLPAMRVGKESELKAWMHSRMQDLDVHAVILRTGDEDLVVRGIAGSDATRQQAYQRWREEAGTVPRPAMTLLLPTDVQHALDQAVAAAGLPALASRWKDKVLQVNPGGLDPSQRPRLHAVLDALNPVYMGALRVEGENPVPASAVPFRVQTVVGGRQPWVVLEDGTRIVVGGKHGAYRLTSVEDGSVIFDGPTTAVIPR